MLEFWWLCFYCYYNYVEIEVNQDQFFLKIRIKICFKSIVRKFDNLVKFFYLDFYKTGKNFNELYKFVLLSVFFF